jgi:hypothetical protein
MRRMFWLSLGAVIGVTGYRRVTALARSLRPEPRPGSLAGFATDVREGMGLYMERQSARTPSTLEGHARRSLDSASRGERPPGAPRWPKGSAGPGGNPRNPRWLQGRAPSRNDELKDGR